jgi:hypothetical protein
MHFTATIAKDYAEYVIYISEERLMIKKARLIADPEFTIKQNKWLKS